MRRWAIRVGRGDAVVKTGAKRSKGGSADGGLGSGSGCGTIFVAAGG